jgi:hypothetical protein
VIRGLSSRIPPVKDAKWLFEQIELGDIGFDPREATIDSIFCGCSNFDNVKLFLGTSGPSTGSIASVLTCDEEMCECAETRV